MLAVSLHDLESSGGDDRGKSASLRERILTSGNVTDGLNLAAIRSALRTTFETIFRFPNLLIPKDLEDARGKLRCAKQTTNIAFRAALLLVGPVAGANRGEAHNNR